MRSRLLYRLLAALAALALVTAACGGEDDQAESANGTAGTDEAGAETEAGNDQDGDEDQADDGAESTEDESEESGEAEASGDDFMESVRASAEQYYAGTWGTPPSDGPPLVDGAKVMHLSCGEALPSCSEPSVFIAEVGAVMGWEIDVRDLNFNIAAAGDLIAEAIAGGYDAVTMQSVDCPAIQPALLDAIDAGLPVVAYYAHDCTTPTVGGDNLMTIVRQSEPWDGMWFQDEAWGRSKADWLINRLDGDVKVITMTQNDILTPLHIAKAFNERIEECPTCEAVANVDFTLPELGDGTFAQKVGQAVAANPDANSIHFLYDGLLLVGGSTALADAGRDDLTVVGGEFTSVNAQLLDTGVQDLIMFYDHKWTAYSTLDTVNRLLNGEEPVIQGQGWQAVDADHPPQVEEGRFRAPTAYEGLYAKLWGLS